MTRLRLPALALLSGLAAVAPAAHAAPLLFDVNSVADASPTQAGWTPVNLSGINGVSFVAVGNVFLGERDRINLNTDDPGADVTRNAMWRDFVFADERTEPGDDPDPGLLDPAGMNIIIQNLVPNAAYAVRLWSWDDVSNPRVGNPNERSMKWNGVPYSFGASPDPASLAQRVVDFSVMANAQGIAVLEGRVDFDFRGGCCNVFVNGFSMTQIPEPGTLMLAGVGLLAAVRVARRAKAG